MTEPMVFSTDETLDIGDEFGSPVTPDYPKERKFSGEVNWVAIDIDKDAIDLDHLISPEERFSPEERMKVAMGIQSPQSGPVAGTSSGTANSRPDNRAGR